MEDGEPNCAHIFAPGLSVRGTSGVAWGELGLGLRDLGLGGVHLGVRRLLLGRSTLNL